MPQTYSTRAFARITGVTVKALRHYERLGLLTPRRSPGRYRRYVAGDVRQLERILALKSLDLPLKTIHALLQNGGGVALGAHRERLEARRARLDRAIAALAAIEADAQPRDAIERFIRDAGWERWEGERRKRAAAIPRAPDRASPSRIALFRQLDAALLDDDANRARELAAAWNEVTDAGTREGWRRRREWPAGMRAYVASLFEASPDAFERVAAFLDGQPER